MNDKEKASPGPKSGSPDPASGGLAESSLNDTSAAPGAPRVDDEGRHKLPGNDQREGLEKAEQAGKKPAKP